MHGCRCIGWISVLDTSKLKEDCTQVFWTCHTFWNDDVMLNDWKTGLEIRVGNPYVVIPQIKGRQILTQGWYSSEQRNVVNFEFSLQRLLWWAWCHLKRTNIISSTSECLSRGIKWWTHLYILIRLHYPTVCIDASHKTKVRFLRLSNYHSMYTFLLSTSVQQAKGGGSNPYKTLIYC